MKKGSNTMKKYTMKDFVEKNIAVKVNKGNIKEFLQMCDAHGLKWQSGHMANKFEPNFYFRDELYILYNHKNSGALNFSTGNCEWENVDFAQIAKTEHYQINIDCDGKTTTAKMMVNGKEVRTATAKRNPADKFNWKLAAQLAFERVWCEQKVREVKRKAAVGEKIKVVDADKTQSKYKNGDVLTVERLFVKKDGVVCEGGALLWNHEYVVLEGCKPKKKAKKQHGVFRVGDRVVCVEATDGKTEAIGKHGRIVDTSFDPQRVSVEFDERIDGHNCHGKAKTGYGWNCEKSFLRHE